MIYCASQNLEHCAVLSPQCPTFQGGCAVQPGHLAPFTRVRRCELSPGSLHVMNSVEDVPRFKVAAGETAIDYVSVPSVPVLSTARFENVYSFIWIVVSAAINRCSLQTSYREQLRACAPGTGGRQTQNGVYLTTQPGPGHCFPSVAALAKW